MTKEIKEEVKKINPKEIGTYKVNFKTRFDLKTDDFIYLDINISEDLKELLKSVCIMDEEVVPIQRHGLSIDRYKVKSWLFNSLYSSEKDFLFTKDLLENAEVSLKFQNTDMILTMVRGIKEGVKEVINNILRYRDYEVDVKYFVSEKKE